VIAAIGASAGGIEAFTELMTNLPADSGMAFVLVQHLDPKHHSLLTELLSKKTAMRVTEVTDGMKVERNHVYVIPPNTTMSISNHSLLLRPREESRGLHMPIDHFMRALAEEHGNRAIGVILSGTGTDGTLGMAEIQAQGGVTFAQDGGSAKHDAMPRRAVAAGRVDYVLPPKGIARELVRIARHPYVARSHKSEPVEVDSRKNMGLSTVFQLLRRTTGVDFTHYRQTTILRRIQRRMVVHQIDKLEEYVKFSFPGTPQVEFKENGREHPGLIRRDENDEGVPSPRERPVIKLLAEGKANKEMAAVLELSTRTVEVYRARIMTKLKLHSVGELVRYAVRHNLIEA
jgi:two-component system, chemotaxis family, CheB/CheR fusion protein